MSSSRLVGSFRSGAMICEVCTRDMCGLELETASDTSHLFNEDDSEPGLAELDGSTEVRLAINSNTFNKAFSDGGWNSKPAISEDAELGATDDDKSRVMIVQQCPDEMIVVSPGLVHQVRNNRPCLKIAWDHAHVCEVDEYVRDREDVLIPSMWGTSVTEVAYSRRSQIGVTE